MLISDYIIVEALSCALGAEDQVPAAGAGGKGFITVEPKGVEKRPQKPLRVFLGEEGEEQRSLKLIIEVVRVITGCLWFMTLARWSVVGGLWAYPLWRETA